jgi:hypothetical protein
MIVDEVVALTAAELGRRCAKLVMRWGENDQERQTFRPCVNSTHALQLVERLGAVDFVLNRCAAIDGGPGFWMAWFGDASQATADTPALAISRAALLYVLEKVVPQDVTDASTRQRWSWPRAVDAHSVN